MNNFPKHVVYLIAFCAILAIAAFCAETSFPEKTSAASARDAIAPSATTTETVEETVTLSASDIKTWLHGYSWHEDHIYCSPSFHIESAPEDIAGSMAVGYHHFWDKGAIVAGCPEAAALVTRGTVWFDLSSIASKAPPLHVFVTRALLHYKMDKGCDDHQLLIAQEDWLKGYPDNKLVPGDNFATIHSSCASEGKSPSDAVCAPEDVAKVLNNWLRGEGNGGYANYGFVFAGTVEEDFLSEKLGHWLDNDACWTRFSDFSLTVTYKYDKKEEPTFLFTGGRKNVALASNGATATASSTYKDPSFSPAKAIDGDHKGLNWLKGGGWVSADPTNNDWLEVVFSGSKTINEIDVFMVQDDPLSPIEPDLSTPSNKYGLTDFTVQYRNRFGVWVDVAAAVTGNMKVLKKFTFPDLTTGRIRVLVSKTPDGYSRLVEVEAYAK